MWTVICGLLRCDISFTAFSACDISKVAQTMLLSHTAPTASRHIFNDVLDLLHDVDRDRAQNIEKQFLSAYKKLKERVPAKREP